MLLLKKVIAPAVVLVLVLSVYVRYKYVLPRVAHELAAAAPQTQPAAGANAAGAEGTEPAVTLVGPLANYMQDQKPTAPAAADSALASDTTHAAKLPQSNSVTPMDRVSNSPLGAGGQILPAKFTMARSASFSFDVPPHANTPRLTGAYHSTGAASPAKVDFVVLTADQYAAMANGTPGEALFSAEASTGQNIDFVLPITRDTAVRYYVVFRGDAKTKKVVSSSLRLEM